MNAKEIYELSNGDKRAYGTMLTEEVKGLPTTPVEEEILRHMSAILKIVERVQPDHEIISMSADNGYFSLMCGGDFENKLYFSVSTRDRNEVADCIHRRNGSDIVSTFCDLNGGNIDSYLWDARVTRLQEAAERKWSISTIE